MKILFLTFSLLITVISYSSKTIETNKIKTDDLNQKSEQNPTSHIIVKNYIPSKSNNHISEIIPIITLLLGFFTGKVYDSWSSKKKVRLEGKEWLETFFQLKDPLEKQIANVSSFLEKNPPTRFKFTSPEFQISLNCEDFKSTDEKSIIPYLQKKYKIEYPKAIKIAGKMKNIVRVIQSISNLFNEAIESLKENSGPHSKAFSVEFQQFRRHIANYMDQISELENPSKGQIILFNKLNELNKKHIINQDIDLFKLSEEFNVEFFNFSYNDRAHPEIIAAVEKLSNCDQLIKNLQMERFYLKEKYTSVQNRYKNSLNSINEIFLELNNSKSKPHIS